MMGVGLSSVTPRPSSVGNDLFFIRF